MAAALVLERLAQEDLPLSAIRDELPRLHMIKDRIQLAAGAALEAETDALRQRLVDRYPDAEQKSEDGLKLQWPDRWLHVRQSNTEPILRIYAEAPTSSEAQVLIEGVREAVASLARQVNGTG